MDPDAGHYATVSAPVPLAFRRRGASPDPARTCRFTASGRLARSSGEALAFRSGNYDPLAGVTDNAEVPTHARCAVTAARAASMESSVSWLVRFRSRRSVSMPRARRVESLHARFLRTRVVVPGGGRHLRTITSLAGGKTSKGPIAHGRRRVLECVAGVACCFVGTCTEFGVIDRDPGCQEDIDTEGSEFPFASPGTGSGYPAGTGWGVDRHSPGLLLLEECEGLRNLGPTLRIGGI